MNAAPRVITHMGELYYRYAGPFDTAGQAIDYAHDCFAAGEFGESDKPTLQHGCIYIRGQS